MLAAATELELDPDPDRWAVVAGDRAGVVVQQRNLVLAGDPSAVNRAIERLP